MHVERLIVIVGGSSIGYQALISVLSSAFKIELPDVAVVILSIIFGAATGAWIAHRSGPKEG